MAQQQVVIVGAGVLGLGTALALSNHESYAITVVEREYPGSGSTSLAAGMALRTSIDPTQFEIGRRAYAILEQLERDAGLSLRRIGFFQPGRTQTEIEAFAEVAQRHADVGWGTTEVLGRDDIERVFPEYTAPDDIIGALWDPEAIYIDGAELCASLAEAVKARGVKIVSHTTIEGIGPGEGESKYLLRGTDGATFATDLVVNTAGPWGGRVGDALEAPVDIANERHEAFIFRHQDIDRLLPMFLDFIPGHSQQEGLYFRGEGNDRILAGLHSSDLLHSEEIVDPDSVSQRHTDDHLEEVFGLLAESFPTVEIGFDRGYAGIYPHHALNRFVLGPHPANPDIYVGAGLGGRGLGPGVALGEVLAEFIVYGAPRTVPAARDYAPDARV